MTHDGLYITAVGREDGINNILFYTDGNTDSPREELAANIITLIQNSKTETEALKVMKKAYMEMEQ